MVDEEDKKDEEEFKFDEAGEVVGYISFDQARVPAIEHARDNRDFYGRRWHRSDTADFRCHLGRSARLVPRRSKDCVHGNARRQPRNLRDEP